MLQSVYETLAENASKWRTSEDWPQESLNRCGQNGIFYGLSGISADAIGEATDSITGRDAEAWSAVEQTETLIELSKSDLLTTFVITQHLGAIKRIAASQRVASAESLRHIRRTVLPALLQGSQIASVGISHLTTSRLHLGRPAVEAIPDENGYRLRGEIPWVTGAPNVEQIVVGATLANGEQILVLLSPSAEGVRIGRSAEMIAMSASCTAAVSLDDVLISNDLVLDGPRENVLAGKRASGDTKSGAGGLQTSTLALGLSYAALDYLSSESAKRPNLSPIVERFEQEHQALHQQIRGAASGEIEVDPGAIRTAANGLVQRTTNAAMTTAKGAGLMADHPVARWCSQALFFLVWSCPQGVAEAHLCELAGLD